MSARRTATAALALALIGVLSGCSDEAPDPAEAAKTDRVEVMSWWTSDSERAALEVIFDAFTAANPDVELEDASVTGGAGSNAQVVLAERLADGDPPDVWQGFVGGYLAASADRGQVADATSAFDASGIEAAMPAAIRDAVTVAGKPYGMPTGSHRSNVLFYNLAALEQAGVTPPGEGYTLARFIDDLETLDEAGVTPLCLGAKDAFTSVELFENVLLSTIGSAGWKRVEDGSFRWTSAEAKDALDSFGQLLDLSDPDSGALTWDGATGKLADGECAFESMNDSAYGELVAQGAEEGADFGYVAFPGTEDSYVAVVDVFVSAAHAPNLANAMAFLATAGESETQLAFNELKGSVPIRTDVDVSSLSDYQQAAAAAYRDQELLLSIAHGEGVDPALHVGLYDAVDTFVRSRDARSFADAIEDAVVVQQPQP